MSDYLNLKARMTIERAVWTIDSQLQDLPRKSRVAKRRELRSNLRAAAAEVGAPEAVRRLGDLRRLAAEYLMSEFGQWGPRPSWSAGLSFSASAYVVLAVLLETGKSAFASGVTATDPNASGTFIWNGVNHVLQPVTFTFADGAATPAGGLHGGAWTPLVYLVLFAGTVLVGRLWRALPVWRRRHPHSPDDN